MSKKPSQPKKRRNHPSAMAPSAEHLCWLAHGLSRSGSRVEDRWWETHLEAAVRQLLAEGNDEVLKQALEHLYRSDEPAYNELLDAVESESEVFRSEHETLLLVAAPVLAWSRFSVPAKTVPPAALEHLRTALATNVFAPGVRFAIANHLFSPDQLPESYLLTHRFLQGMQEAARKNEDYAIDASRLNETMVFLSDIRYLLIAAAIPKGEAIFRWHLPEGERGQSFDAWRKRAVPVFERLLVGCGIELQPPDAFFTASREANRQSRLFAIYAAVAFLATEYDIASSRLRAVIAPCEGDGEFEFRISLCLKPSGEVVHGVPWPLIGTDENEEETVEQIVATLRDCGVTDTLVLRRTLPMEFCEDCGAPLFPNAQGELVHAEIPGENRSSDEPFDHTTPPPRYLH